MGIMNMSVALLLMAKMRDITTQSYPLQLTAGDHPDLATMTLIAYS